MAAKIVVVGSFNMDLNLAMPDLPQPGQVLLAQDYTFGPGGKGSNQAVAAARLGADVTFIGRIGRDVFGDEALRLWWAEDINTDFVTRDPVLSTGVSPTFLDTNGEQLRAIALGANQALSIANIDVAADVIRDADVLITQLEITHETAAHALALARRLHTKTILDPSPANHVSLDMLAYADFLTPNEIEIEQLYGASDLYLEDAARYLLTSDEQAVVVTMGAQGARWIKRDGTAGVPTFDVDVVDTAAAGDAFCGGLAVAIAEGRQLPDAVRFANATAALCTTYPGSAVSMPQRQEVEALLRQS